MINDGTDGRRLLTALYLKPQARARIFGDPNHSRIFGTARFYQTDQGVLTAVEVSGLPSPERNCRSPIFALHIHAGTSCSGDAQNPFRGAAAHYDPDSCPHPYHAGDLPPLFGSHGYALSVFLTDRFTVREIIGKTIIIHEKPDDFSTQPSGAAGEKIACGEIVSVSML